MEFVEILTKSVQFLSLTKFEGLQVSHERQNWTNNASYKFKTIIILYIHNSTVLEKLASRNNLILPLKYVPVDTWSISISKSLQIQLESTN